MDVLLLFPHQLFASNATLARDKHVLLIEDALYFRQYAFHKQKLILHRASMQAHATFLRQANIQVDYLNAGDAPTMQSVIERACALQPDRLHFIDPVDDWLDRRIEREARRAVLKLVRHPTPMFLTSSAGIDEYFETRGTRILMADFYIAQRKRLNVLMDHGRPVGGKWSFDAQNRKKLPRGIELPLLWSPARSEAVEEATRYVRAHFAHNPGESATFTYPTTHADARRWLRDFIDNRFVNFGDYQDAISAGDSTLFHSVLTPMLNTGLLNPDEVLDEVLGAPGIPLNSLEGFVRQLIGWREFMRAVYVVHGRTQRTSNFWNHERPLPESFWKATTGIDPVDTVIRRVLQGAYAHHIERLMILGNFMQLCGFRPDDVYRWFMELFIDAYDWVMVPNVYGMGIYADGGMIATKPYIAGSNYVRKMSNFKPGAWCETWDGLFWSFIARHRDFFASNSRLAVIVRQLDRMQPNLYRAHLQRAEVFLSARSMT